MALVLPFKAVRPAREFAAQVAALPYDVMSREEGRKTVAGKPWSFLRVEKSEVDVPEETKDGDNLIYQKARENFVRMIAEKVMIQDETPHFYIYRQQMGKRIQTGIVGCVSAAEYDAGKIKKHEFTRRDKEEDRINHVNTVGAQTGPVFLTYKANPGLNEIVSEITARRPEYDFTADDGFIHKSWLVDDLNQIEQIRNQFADIDSLYIADGHHRAAAASSVAKMRRSCDCDNSGNKEYEKVLAVLFPHDELYVMDYNRAVEDLNGLSKDEFLEKISSRFIIEKNFQAKLPRQFHDFGMYLQGEWYQLTIKQGAFDDSDPVKRLDASILQECLLSPVLRINDPRTDKRIKFIGGIRGMAELEKLVDKDGFAVAFSLYPTAIEQVMQVADAGAIMPPKSTWFEPKLRSGLFVHKI